MDIPESVLEYGFDFDWDEKDVWKVKCPVIEISINELLWHFDIPFWNYQGKEYVLTPNEVIENPIIYHEEYDRIMSADIQYPIDVMKNKGRLVILDGLHRLVKCKLLGYKKIKVRIIPPEKKNEFAR